MTKIVTNNLLLEINVITSNKVISGHFFFRFSFDPYTYVKVKFQRRFFCPIENN